MYFLISEHASRLYTFFVLSFIACNLHLTLLVVSSMSVPEAFLSIWRKARKLYEEDTFYCFFLQAERCTKTVFLNCTYIIASCWNNLQNWPIGCPMLAIFSFQVKDSLKQSFKKLFVNKATSVAINQLDLSCILPLCLLQWWVKGFYIFLVFWSKFLPFSNLIVFSYIVAKTQKLYPPMTSSSLDRLKPSKSHKLNSLRLLRRKKRQWAIQTL